MWLVYGPAMSDAPKKPNRSGSTKPTRPTTVTDKLRVLFKRRSSWSKDAVHAYWANPSDEVNAPDRYLEGKVKSDFLLSIMERFVDKDADILEIGCNVGRNLNRLYEAGYHNLVGIEINRHATELMKQAYPEMAANAIIHNGSVEDVIPTLDDEAFDAVFTVAVLEHIHWKSEWVFEEIVRATNDTLITIEDERGRTPRHFPRNYAPLFEGIGMGQILSICCDEIDGLGSDFYCRVFRKADGRDQESKGGE